MNSKRLFIILSGAISLVLLAMVGGAYEINSLLSSKSNTLVSLKAKSQSLTQEQTILVKDKKDLAKYASLSQIAQTVVPQDKDQAEAVREINDIASANGITLSSITFPASSLGGAGGTTTTGGTAVTTPAAGNSKTNALSQLVPVKNIPQVYQLAITIQSDINSPVPYPQFINFLSAMEHNRRTSQISGLTLTPMPKEPSLLSFSLNVNEYIKP